MSVIFILYLVLVMLRSYHETTHSGINIS